MILYSKFWAVFVVPPLFTACVFVILSVVRPVITKLFGRLSLVNVIPLKVIAELFCFFEGKQSLLFRDG